MKENVFGKNLKGRTCKIIFCREALWGCADWDIIPAVAADIIPEAADYVLSKEEEERFTIVSESLRTVVTGVVTYKDEQELELRVTNVYGDVYIIKAHDHFKID